MHLKELDANLIVVFDALLVDASVTKAAERLGRSPSAISHALANLRDIFDDPLFVRAGQRLVPTAKAQSLAPTIHIIVSGIESLIRPSAPFDPHMQERRFILACRGAFELTLLPDLRKIVKKLAPGISLSWTTLNIQTFYEDLRVGRIHFAIHEGEPKEETSDFCWQHLNHDRYVTIVHKGHSLAAQSKKITLKMFQDSEHIFIAGQSEMFRSHLINLDIAISEAIEVSSVLAGLVLTLQSDALLTLPETMVQTIAKHVDISVIKQPFPELAVPNFLGWHRSLERDECHEWLRQKFQDIAF